MAEFFRRAGRSLAGALCVVLVLASACMALAVLVQALAVFVVAVLAAALFLPHPLTWYAKEGAEAVKLFVRELAGPLMAEQGGEEGAGEAAPPSPPSSAPSPSVEI